MKMMKRAASKRFAALVVLGSMLFALAAPQASAADQTTDKTESYTTTATYYDGEATEEQNVTYQIGGKTITLKSLYKYVEYDSAEFYGRVFTREQTEIYTLSKPLKAIERKEDGNVIWSVPAGTTVTAVHKDTQAYDGTVSYEGEHAYIGALEADRYFSAAELESNKMDIAVDEGRIKFVSDVSEEDKGITIQKGKMYQIVDFGSSGFFALPGNFVFLGV